MFNIPISVGTIKKHGSRCAVKVEEANAISAVKLKSSHHKHADETGCRADGKTRWVHCLSNELYTFLFLHDKRGRIAKSKGKYTGRKPVEVDEQLWDSLYELWSEGKITAVEFMGRMNMRKSTFYRRINAVER